MTRLREEDIENITAELEQYDRQLEKLTRRNLLGLAAYTLSREESDLSRIISQIKIGVVPVNSGQGVITGFSQTVAAIVTHLGFQGFITRTADVSGIAEAVESGAPIIMMADDLRFVAINIKNGTVIDNTQATAKGFVAGLDLMAQGLKGRSVLVIGCGPVGWEAVREILHRGAEAAVFDIQPHRCVQLQAHFQQQSGISITIEKELTTALNHHDLIVEATNAPAIIESSMITPRTIIAAPGMPLGVTPSAAAQLSDRLLHDPLQIGAAVMAIQAITTPKTLLP